MITKSVSDELNGSGPKLWSGTYADYLGYRDENVFDTLSRSSSPSSSRSGSASLNHLDTGTQPYYSKIINSSSWYSDFPKARRPKCFHNDDHECGKDSLKLNFSKNSRMRASMISQLQLPARRMQLLHVPTIESPSSSQQMHSSLSELTTVTSSNSTGTAIPLSNPLASSICSYPQKRL